jgi:phosphatidylglycerol---prolipoprotein diacylglyceryl transferase
MENFLYFYQHLPQNINPVAFSIGSFSVEWYSLMYLVGFFIVYLLLNYRLKKGEGILNKNLILNFLFYAFIGLLIGARLGYAIFYNFSFYLHNPLTIISPFDLKTGEFIGIYGMSYHGGLIGVIITSLIFAKNYKINFWQLTNFVIPAIPAGYFFGRLGNFFNGELYGRITNKIWGMYFPSPNFIPAQLRHPSQLYEALLEGLLTFLILWPLRNNPKFKNKLFGFYLVFYAMARIIAEFFRQPDEQIGYIGNFLTLGQILSFFMLIFGLILIFMVNYDYTNKTSNGHH